ncbi:PX domain-containing protein kinase-like protein isoform X2 [Liolophura sinensis]|uniref:PX domain-containing protein kinase-like protein isoform X2 n=1 Tax=Liolophura sinensis TaxID=3198878 RepID=UPI0031598C5F
MAVFEQKKCSKVTLDDTTTLTCSIENAQNVKDHIEYIIRVQRGPVPENSWTIQKRYSDFVKLDEELKFANLEFQLPPKKVFGNKEREFIAERQHGLQNFMNQLLSSLFLSSSIIVKRFFDPEGYSANLRESALQHVSMVFRSEPNWEVVETLPEIGWRLRKHYIQVKPIAQPKRRQFLTWNEYGPAKFMPDKETAALFKVFPAIQHPNIYPIAFATANENGALIIRDFFEKGTLRDYICGCKPKGHFLKKYGKVKTYTVMKMNEVKIIGRQILDTIKFLQDKGLPYCHLHAGNVILDSSLGQCKLLDVENWLIGLPSLYRPYFSQFRKIHTTDLIDVYCFGQLLYEMVFGKQLDSPICDMFPSDCPAQIRSVLESILTTEACKKGLPSISDLLLHPLFSDVVLPPSEKPSLKIPSKLKEAIRLAREKMEQHLQAEQKLISQYRRLSKATAFHMSEEEKKKRRKSKKKALENGGQEVTSPTSPMSPAESSPAPPAAPAMPTSPAGPP